MSRRTPGAQESAFLQDALLSLLEGTTELPASELTRVVNVVATVLGAERARVFVADYALVWLHELGEDGPTGDARAIEGTLAGHAFVRDEVIVSRDEPTLVYVPLSEGSERLGVLELSYESWTDDERAALAPVVRVLVLVLISKRRYGCRATGTATRTAVDRCRVAVGLTSSVDVLHGSRVGKRHPRTCVFNRR
jgi:hypothetical protein